MARLPPCREPRGPGGSAGTGSGGRARRKPRPWPLRLGLTEGVIRTTLTGGVRQETAGRDATERPPFSPSWANTNFKLRKGLSPESNPFQSNTHHPPDNGEGARTERSPAGMCPQRSPGGRGDHGCSGTTCGGAPVRSRQGQGRIPGAAPPGPQRQQHRRPQVTTANPRTMFRTAAMGYTTYCSKELKIHIPSSIPYFINNVFTQLGPYVLCSFQKPDVMELRGEGRTFEE